MSVYTRTGDGGQTSLYSKERIDKDDPRVEAYGTVDEASAVMGQAKAALPDNSWAVDWLENIQQQIISLNADLATRFAQGEPSPSGRITEEHVRRLEARIDELEKRRIPQHYFVTYGATPASAALDTARSIIRRAERRAIALRKREPVPSAVLLYLNRLSDLLFVMARCLEQETLAAKVTEKVVRTLQEQQGAQTVAPVLRGARKLAALAEEKAVDIGVPMVIAVVDSAGNLVLQHRMDGSLLASLTIARDKAYTAAALRMTTEEAGRQAQPGGPLYGVNTIEEGRYVIFGGGLPLFKNGRLIGGLGISGGTVEEDMLVAQTALDAWQKGGIGACR